MRGYNKLALYDAEMARELWELERHTTNVCHEVQENIVPPHDKAMSAEVVDATKMKDPR